MNTLYTPNTCLSLILTTQNYSRNKYYSYLTEEIQRKSNYAQVSKTETRLELQSPLRPIYLYSAL